MTAFDEGQPQDPRIIETASGTTSPSNSDSGGFAYVIAVVAVALSLLIGTGLSGCMSLVNGFIEYEYIGGQPDYSTDTYDFDYDFDFDDEANPFYNDYLPEDFLENFGTEDGDGSSTVTVTTPQSSTLEEALGDSLAMYDTTIDSLLPAMSYANANPDVRGYVRDIVLVDRDASSELHNVLRSAAWGDVEVSEALALASEKAEATAEELREKELPTIEGDNAAEASRQLELGRSAAIDRWEAIASELELLAGAEDSVDMALLEEADAQVATAASDAASAFGEALSASASL